MLTAKSLGGGYPLAGITGGADIMDAPPPGSIGGTYGGNPVACAAALAVFIIQDEDLPARAEAIGTCVRERFEALQRRFPVVGEVRGRGAMMAMELVEDLETKAPAAALAKEVRAQLFERGALCLLAGAGDNVVRLLVLPLTIEDELLDRGLDLMEAGLEAAVAKRSAG